TRLIRYLQTSALRQIRLWSKLPVIASPFGPFEMIHRGPHFIDAFRYRIALLRQSFGEIIMKKLLLCATTMICFLALAHTASARSAYDGSWDLVFVTQRGACDPTYNFTVNISNGVVTHPNLVQFKGYVAKSGAVRASVTVQDEFASGIGRFFGTSGRGKWSAHAG